MNILIVEDDSQTAKSVSSYLLDFGYSCDLVETGREAIAKLSNDKYDLLILDWTLPDLTGLDILRTYISSGGESPVLFLTGQTSMHHKELGFSSGADDYLTKPFELKELKLRVEALLRRRADLVTHVGLGDLLLDKKLMTLKKEDTEILLSKKEFAVISFLMSNQYEVCKTKDILDSAWTGESASSATLQVLITRLRKKLQNSNSCVSVQSVFGVGYRLITSDDKS